MTVSTSFDQVRLLRAAMLATTLGLAPVACGGGGSGGEPDPTQPTPQQPAPNQGPGVVAMGDNFFRPAADTVAVGGTVTWTNAGYNPHTSTGQNSLWNSGTLNPGQSFSREFPQAGSFAYECTIHPGMNGTVVVR